MINIILYDHSEVYVVNGEDEFYIPSPDKHHMSFARKLSAAFNCPLKEVSAKQLGVWLDANPDKTWDAKTLLNI